MDRFLFLKEHHEDLYNIYCEITKLQEQNNMKRKFSLFLAYLLLFLLLFAFGGMVCAAENDGSITALSDLKGKIIAVQTGTNDDVHVKENATLKGNVEFAHYNTQTDMVEALKAYKVAAALMDKPVALIYCNKNSELTILDEAISSANYGIGFHKGSPYVAQFNQAFAQMKEQGTFKKLEEKWTGADERVKKTIPQDWQAPKGTLHYWIETMYEPISYVGENGTPLGYDVDIVLEAAKRLGYRIDITQCSFDGLIPAVVAGKADLIGSGIEITEEHKQSIALSDTTYHTKLVMVVLKPKVSVGTQRQGICAFLKNSFQKTFLKEARWKMFTHGILTTLLITSLSTLLGTLLGFAIYIFCRASWKKLTAFFEGCFSLLGRIPVIVVLMVLYYVIFGNFDMSGVAVSVVAFTLTFAAAMYEMLKTGVATVPMGQTEAGYALGYNRVATFFKIVLPQAAGVILPSYKGEVITLLEATAVVGYIAVQDLTKMGDLVRSRTYEAFFPLITTAVVYVLLSYLLTWIINMLGNKLDPKKRSRETILKGVKTK